LTSNQKIIVSSLRVYLFVKPFSTGAVWEGGRRLGEGNNYDLKNNGLFG